MEIIGTSSVSNAVEGLIGNARQQLILVTPYFKPWDRVGKEIKSAKVRGVNVLMLLRGGDDRSKQEEKAREFNALGVKVGYLSRLHAKIYVSESEAIVTSMNLYEESALNSWEVAIRFRKDVDLDAYKEVMSQVIELCRRCDAEAKVAALEKPKVDLTPNPTRRPASVVTASGLVKARANSQGFCIRCATAVALNADRPLCNSCYKAWAKYENPDYEEKHCHACGSPKATSVAKPLCRPCWQASA